MLKPNVFPGLHELFKGGEVTYYFDTEDGLDNIESMKFFLNEVGIPNDLISLNDGTQVILKHPKYSYSLILNSSGNGDEFSHIVEVTCLY